MPHLAVLSPVQVPAVLRGADALLANMQAQLDRYIEDEGAETASLEVFQNEYLLPSGSKYHGTGQPAGSPDGTTSSYYLTPLSEKRAEIIFSERMDALARAES